MRVNLKEPLFSLAKSFIGRTLAILKDLVEAVTGEATKSKTIVYKSVQESLHTTLALFPVYIHEPGRNIASTKHPLVVGLIALKFCPTLSNPVRRTYTFLLFCPFSSRLVDVVDSILGFLLAVFGAFQLQLGVAYTEQIIHRLLGMFTQNQLQETIAQELSAGSRVLEKFLRILRLLAQQTGSSFKTLLPNIINFCLDQIYPLIAEVSCAWFSNCFSFFSYPVHSCRANYI